jgi:cyclophilin family peptidyl-prolyl cis-trans isomerase
MPRVSWPAVGLAILIGLAGCSARPAESESSPETPAETAVDPAVRFNQPFDQATTDEVGPDQLPPPDHTVAGKSTADMREAVERHWAKIQIADAAGQPIAWVVTLDTDEGPIEIALRPDLAPNHVRNLIALVQAEYYDGLRFDRLVHQQAVDPNGVRSDIHMVRFGCPAGTGDPGVGHIGYRLKSEFTETSHEAGTVGFTRDADPSSAGVRLYITTAPAPALDNSYTIVGKVSKGMDVVERIAAGKLLPPDIDPTRELPERPITIRRATARLVEFH